MTVLFADSSTRRRARTSATRRTCARRSVRSRAHARASSSVRRDVREVHRRRGDGRLRRAGRARGRPRARRPRSARDPRRHSPACRSRSTPARRSSRSLRSSGTREGIATGDVVNTTFRIEEAADADTVLVGEATYRATQGAIEYGERRLLQAKGKADPVAVYEALRTRPELGDARGPPPLAPLVGRKEELEPDPRHDRARTTATAQFSSSRSSAFPGSARAGSSGSCSARSPTTPGSSPGAVGAVCPTARASRSGHSARW